MEFEEIGNRHYIRVNADSCIVDGWSDGPHNGRTPTEDDILLTDKGGYQFRLFPNGAENPALFDGMNMIPLYKYINGEVVARSDEELAADRQAWEAEQERIANLPTREDIIEAQVTYTALMTDTLLPEEE